MLIVVIANMGAQITIFSIGLERNLMQFINPIRGSLLLLSIPIKSPYLVTDLTIRAEWVNKSTTITTTTFIKGKRTVYQIREIEYKLPWLLVAVVRLCRGQAQIAESFSRIKGIWKLLIIKVLIKLWETMNQVKEKNLVSGHILVNTLILKSI